MTIIPASSWWSQTSSQTSTYCSGVLSLFPEHPASFQNNHTACIYLLLRVKLTQSSAAHTGTDLHNQAFLWVPCEKPASVGLESHEAISKPALLQPSEDLRAVLSGHLKKPCQVDSEPLTRASNILHCRKRIPLPFNPQQSEKRL